MPARRTSQIDPRLAAELEHARDLVWAWDQLAAAGAPVARKQKEARERVRALEKETSAATGR